MPEVDANKKKRNSTEREVYRNKSYVKKERSQTT